MVASKGSGFASAGPVLPGPPRWVWALAALCRVVLVAYGSWQDLHLAVKYTDVDYRVFSDAAALAWRGGSPYDRATFRYPPMLAWLLVPNVAVAWFGKALFCAADLAAGWAIARLSAPQHASAAAASWLLNPVVINISTRGNCDAIVCLALLLLALALVHHRIGAASALLGAAVHFRLFPVLFAPALALFCWRRKDGRGSLASAIRFAAQSAALFFALTAASYAAYGAPFLNESLLYHLVRTDNRHNFSLYFYSLYLEYGQALGLATGLAAFLPMMLVQAALSLRFFHEPLLCMCLQTMAFVAFNKVCTAQYFVWYTALLPVALQRGRGPAATLPSATVIAAALAAWLAAEINWLYWAYLLEFEGHNTFTQLWVSAGLFFAVNIAIIAAIIVQHNSNGKTL
jgi:phosphatidylinositol glycan class M